METNFSKSHEEMQLERIYTVAEPKGWWHKEVEELKQQLDGHIKREVMLRYAISWCRKVTVDLDIHDALDHALAATDDLGGLILCHAEPIAWQSYHNRAMPELSVEFDEPELVKSFNDDVVWKKPLYRAWEPKP